MKLKLSEIAKTLGYKHLGDDVAISGVSIDTRTIKAGDLFFAITGENFNGHDYINQAIDAGAVAVVIDQSVAGKFPALKVDSVRTALAEIAKFWRSIFELPVVAITGSNGKTTVKEMLNSIFSQRDSTLSTLGNLNNDLGVPLTLMRLRVSHEYAAIEIGANHIGEISQIVQWVKPSVCIVTMIGDSHLEGFGSVAGIVKAKSEIFEGLDGDGVAIINHDDDFYEDQVSAANGNKIVSFGFSEGSDVIGRVDNGILIVETNGLVFNVNMQLLGLHNYKNALAAIAAALECGLSVNEIQKGLEKMKAVKGRLRKCDSVKSYNVIDDSYNANPESVKAAIDVLIAQGGCHCLVLGDMKELGADEVVLHQEIGRYAKEQGLTYLLCKGDLVKATADAFGLGGYYNNDFDGLLERFKAVVPKGCNVLVKGSRSTKMENFIELLSNQRTYKSMSAGNLS